MKKADVSRTQGVSHETCILFFDNYAKFHQCEICKMDNGINDINGTRIVLMTKIKTIVIVKMLMIRITIATIERNV